LPAGFSAGVLRAIYGVQAFRVKSKRGRRATMPETVSVRVARLEKLMGRLAEKQEKLDDVLVLLTEAQIRTEESFKETAERFRETAQQLRETAQQLRETDQQLREVDKNSRERDRYLDERVDKLVSAIGEMLRTGRAN